MRGVAEYVDQSSCERKGKDRVKSLGEPSATNRGC